MSRWVHDVILRSTLKSMVHSLSTRTFCRSTLLFSHYDTLKINPAATLKEIKDSYLKLTKQYHPDLHPNDPKCHERFIELQEAYKILSNPDSRREYDAKVRNRPSPKYQRPYAYPDFTQRDEWIKQEQMRREAHFQKDFSRQEFNKHFSRPHQLSPDEMERFYKYQKYVKSDKFLYFLFGFVLVGVFLEALLVNHKQSMVLWNNHMGVTDYSKSKPYSVPLDVQYEQWNRQRPKTMDEEDWNKITRSRENPHSARRNN